MKIYMIKTKHNIFVIPAVSQEEAIEKITGSFYIQVEVLEIQEIRLKPFLNGNEVMFMGR